MSEDNLRLDIDNIPMPTKEELEGSKPSNGNEEVNESWKRAQNALKKIGGTRSAPLLPTPTTSSYVPPFCFPNIQSFTSVPRIPNSFKPQPNNSIPTASTFYSKPSNTFRPFSPRQFNPINLPSQPISNMANYRSKGLFN